MPLLEEAMSGFSLLINGRLTSGAATLDVINPATEQLLAVAPRADQTQLNQAVAAAKAAFPAWSATPLRARGDLLLKLAIALEARQDEFARLLTEEQGKPLPHAKGEIAGSIGMIRYYASLDLPLTVLKDDDQRKVVQQRTPLGVVATITPWNFPMLLLMMKVAPALLAGNTVVAKPAPTTPLTTLRFGELCAEVFPAGVVNVIVDRNDLGDALTSHPDVAKVSFTGSTVTGKKVMASVAGTLKRLTLELGGNDAAIVLDDSDLKTVAPKVFAGAMMNSGQVCLAIKRLYETVVDDGLKQGTQMGPLQNKTQFEKVKGYLNDARQNGKIVAGGDVSNRKGYFVDPTIVRDIADDARLVQEEQFGPVLPVLRYSDIDEVIARANNTQYGLGGTIWSSNLDRAFEVAAKIDSGTVWINQHMDLPADIACTGAKQSGIGQQMGQEGLEEFTQMKMINMAK
jgi:acyl-CoA reductase-like NAD-dependent aldehyde dehydrogenase